MRRYDHPNRPNAITCCFACSLKTLLMPSKANSRSSVSMFGVVSFNGCFWLTPEVRRLCWLRLGLPRLQIVDAAGFANWSEGIRTVPGWDRPPKNSLEEALLQPSREQRSNWGSRLRGVPSLPVHHLQMATSCSQRFTIWLRHWCRR